MYPSVGSPISLRLFYPFISSSIIHIFLNHLRISLRLTVSLSLYMSIFPTKILPWFHKPQQNNQNQKAINNIGRLEATIQYTDCSMILRFCGLPPWCPILQRKPRISAQLLVSALQSPLIWNHSCICLVPWTFFDPDIWRIQPLRFIWCSARCPNPRAGREKASKTMQLAKREVYCWLESGLLPHPTQWCGVWEPRAQAVTPIYRVSTRRW